MKVISIFSNSDLLPDRRGSLLSIVRNKKEAREVIESYLIHVNREHYKQWCSLRNYNSTSGAVIEQYIAQVLGIEVLNSFFTIIVTKVPKKELFGMLRLANCCWVMNTSFASSAEIRFIEEQVSKVSKEQTTNEAQNNDLIC